jgi:hypothetical protein
LHVQLIDETTVEKEYQVVKKKRNNERKSGEAPFGLQAFAQLKIKMNAEQEAFGGAFGLGLREPLPGATWISERNAA